MRHWLDELASCFGPDAKIALDVEPMRCVTLTVQVRRQGRVFEIGKRTDWFEIEMSKPDPLLRLAASAISDWYADWG